MNPRRNTAPITGPVPSLKVTDNLDGDNSRVIMDRAIPFIDAAVNSDKPFFAVVWFHSPHLPVVAGPKHLALYPEGDLYTRNYYGCITAMDEQIGQSPCAVSLN